MNKILNSVKSLKRFRLFTVKSYSLPVSYTHLDVYKRQTLVCSLNGVLL